MVIVGSGFGGLFAARALRRAPVQVTLVGCTNHHLFQPLLYQVATGILSAGEIAPATRDVLRHHRNTDVVLGEVTDIDVDDRVVLASQPGRSLRIPYDSLIVATGIATSYYGHDDYALWAPGMKTVDDALELRARIFGAFEMAETAPDPESRAPWLTFVVVGGGPTGVEMAGQIAELSRRSLKDNFRHFDPAEARVLLFEGGPELLGTFGPRLAAVTARDMRRLGVEVHTNAMVTALDGDGVDVRLGDGSVQHHPARTKLWAAGMTASPLGRILAERTGAELDRMGRVRVRDDCTLPGHPEVFVVGDLMALGDLPGMAEVAMQSGRHAAGQIVDRLKGRPASPFRYRDLGSMAAISRFRAVAKFRRLSLSGFPGWLLWMFVHLAFLTGFKNRFTAVLHWAISFVGRGRSERTSTAQQLLGRRAVELLESTGSAPQAGGGTSGAGGVAGDARSTDVRR